jgi:hypothetical protein
MPLALASVDKTLIWKWLEKCMLRWTEAYWDGLAVNDTQICVQAFSSKKYTSYHCIPDHLLLVYCCIWFDLHYYIYEHCIWNDFFIWSTFVSWWNLGRQKFITWSILVQIKIGQNVLTSWSIESIYITREIQNLSNFGCSIWVAQE